MTADMPPAVRDELAGIVARALVRRDEREREARVRGWIRDDGGRERAGFRGEAGDCVTRAVAIASGLPYREVYDALSAGMRVRGDTFANGRRRTPRDGVPRKVYEPYLLGLGFTWTPTMAIGTGTRVHLRADELPDGRLVASCSRHLVAVIDGLVHDTDDPTRGGTRAVYGYYRMGTR